MSNAKQFHMEPEKREINTFSWVEARKKKNKKENYEDETWIKGGRDQPNWTEKERKAKQGQIKKFKVPRHTKH